MKSKKRLIPRQSEEQKELGFTSWGYSFQNGGEVPKFGYGGNVDKMRKMQIGGLAAGLFQKGGTPPSQFKALTGVTEKEIADAQGNKSLYRFTPGTYDSTDTTMANQYAGIESEREFGASQEQARGKIDYGSAYGARTAAGMAGDRGKAGIDMTTRLADERKAFAQELSANPQETAQKYEGRMMKKGDTTFVLDTTGKYVIGTMSQSSTTTKPMSPNHFVVEAGGSKPMLDAQGNPKINPLNGKPIMEVQPGKEKAYYKNPETGELTPLPQFDRVLTDSQLKNYATGSGRRGRIGAGKNLQNVMPDSNLIVK